MIVEKRAASLRKLHCLIRRKRLMHRNQFGCFLLAKIILYFLFESFSKPPFYGLLFMMKKNLHSFCRENYVFTLFLKLISYCRHLLKLNSKFLINKVVTAKRKCYRSIVSSITQKFDNRLFVDLHVLYKLKT